jgi:hypothetical protein
VEKIQDYCCYFIEAQFTSATKNYRIIKNKNERRLDSAIDKFKSGKSFSNDLIENKIEYICWWTLGRLFVLAKKLTEES